ncbi:sigma-54-dependent transcriptional regulator [Gemmatimonadota bacterium]
MNSASVLVVDDERLIRVWLEAQLEEAGYQVTLAEDAESARRSFLDNPPDAALLDLKLPDGNGLDLLKELMDVDPNAVAVILTAHGDIDTAVKAVKLGAYQFLEKPPKLEDLLITIEKGLETRTLKRTVSGLRRQAGWQVAGVEIVGRSAAMKRIVELVNRVAASEGSTVLLRGESGVGKEVAAQAIHAQSARAEFAFLEINCTALPETLLESELFGHERGAFTDARERRIGLLELADRGTVLLDEIGDLSPGSQAKLLRFLETRTFKRVGGVRDIKVDVRIVASTNRDLEAAVRDGGFRQDLFYRINVVPITIPPLRERPDDVAPLASFFLESMKAELRRPATRISNAAFKMLERYAWPGNVRELRNVIERTLILEEASEILPDHLPDELQLGKGAVSLAPGLKLPAGGINLEELEKDLILQALTQAGGNKTKAATLLGMSRDTLRYRLEKYELEA